MSETDKEFVADMEWLHSHDREAALPPEKLARLFALARRGADAADEIERLTEERDRQYNYNAEIIAKYAALEAESERLRAALREIAKVTYGYEPFMPDEEAKEYFKSRFFGAQANARAALGGR